MNDRAQPSRSTAPAAGSVGVGVIGFGPWGRNLVRNVATLGALRAVCDATPAARREFAGQYPRVPVLETAESVLASAAVDAVMIATPAATHGSLVAAALAAGKHVFVEKPLCLDVAEGAKLVEQARVAERVLMVGHLLLYHPAFVALKAAVAAGRLGTLRYIYSTRLSLGRIRREENALWSFAPHDVSMILALTGAMPERLIAAGGQYLAPGVADTTLSHLTFANGLQAHIFVSWLHPYKDQRLVVIGDAGMAVFNDIADGDDKLLLYPHTARWSGEIPVVDRAEALPIRYEPSEPLRRECETFLGAVRGDLAPPSDGAEGLRVLRVLNACQQALETGQPVDFSGAA